MGWSGGTEIFDCVAAELMNFQVNTYDVDLPRYRMLNLLSSLKCTLEDQDWDNACESAYWTHPIIGKILGNIFEEDEDTFHSMGVDDEDWFFNPNDGD